MGEYIKHNSNYIKTVRHQFLKDGSTIYERDWVTVGSQLNFGPGKIPYYNDGNFIFTTSPTPFYQKRYKNGVTVGMWTYEDVKNASDVVNKVNFDEYTEDIRTYAYYGSCLELVKVSIENIIRTFPGNITVSDDEIGFKKRIESFDTNSCSQSLAENYVPVTGESTGFYYLNNPFDININLKDVQLSYYDNPLHYLHHSFKDYKVSYDNGENWEDIEKYDIVSRTLYEKIPDDAPCVQTVKSRYNSVSFQKLYKATWKRSVDGEVLHEEYYESGTATNWDTPGALWDRVDGDDRVEVNMPYTVRQDVVFVLREGCEVENVDIEIVTSKTFRKRITLKKTKYFITYNNVKDGWQSICYTQGETPKFEISSSANYVKYISNGSSGTLYAVTSQGDVRIRDVSNERISVVFYSVETIYHTYKSYQMFSEDEVPQGWVRSTCPLDFWFPKTSGQNTTNAETNFLNLCDNENHKVLRYSYLDTRPSVNQNQPVYTITINDTHKIEGYIYNKQVIPLTKDRNLIIQPKEDVIEEYFDGLEGFEKLLLTRKTKPLYLNKFVTPIEYNSDYVYYKRSYTWPSNGYCIDITSPRYFDFINKLSNMAQLFDELWTDNLWRRMTHEAIKNYDWTYTREFKEGDEVDNVDGGERMHKVINIIGRVFDDIKRTIDTIKKNNRVTYNGDRNIPNALLSDKLELNGWDIYSTIWSYPEEIEEENSGESEEETEGETEEETQTRMVSASEQTITREFLDDEENYYVLNDTYVEEKWYPTLDPTKMTFADVDNDFMRKLLLSSRRIFETKGTRHAIDMVMGMFGYGNMDEEHPEYSITEEYYTVIPRNYDEEAGLDEFEDPESFGDRIVRLNTMSKQSEMLYDEDASGIPVGSFVIYNKDEETQEQIPTTYLIPFYNQNKIYDGNLYFQTKGGWIYNGVYENSESEIDEFSWTETVSYLHVVSQVKDLLSVNPNSAGNGDIFYVVNVNDYIEYTEEPLYSNFFVLEDDFNPENLSSWTNLNLEEGWYDETTVGYEDDEIERYKHYVEKAKYLDSIIPYTIANNPHVGYGKYDMGKEFYDYLKQPFKYSIDKEDFDSVDHKTEAENIRFDTDAEGNTTNDDGKLYWEQFKAVENNEKIQIIANKEESEEAEEKGIIEKYYDIVKNEEVEESDDWGILKSREYNLDAMKTFIKENYFINCKVVHFKNLINDTSGNYISYFKEVIMKYLMQIVPSTTIFVLENFEVSNEEEETIVRVGAVWKYANGRSIRQPVEVGTSVQARDGLDWCLTQQGDIINSWPYTVNTSTTFYEYVPIKYTVHFIYRNGIQTTQEVEKDNYASNGGQWCLRGSEDIVDLSQYAITQETWFVEAVTYSVVFYNTNGSSVIWRKDDIRSGESIDRPDNGSYYYKGDKSRVGYFPHNVQIDEEFVKFAMFNVNFIEDGRTIDIQRVRDGLTATNPGGQWCLVQGGSEVNVALQIITQNTTFYRWVAPIETYTITFYEADGTTVETSYTVSEGDIINKPNPNAYYYRKSERNEDVVKNNVCIGTTPVIPEVTFGFMARQNEEFVKFYIVRFWQDLSTLLQTRKIPQGGRTSTLERYPLWHDKTDPSKASVTFPYPNKYYHPEGLQQDVDFVAIYSWEVNFYDTNGETLLHKQYVINGRTVEAYNHYDYYMYGDFNKTKVDFPYTVTRHLFFVRMNTYGRPLDETPVII